MATDDQINQSLDSTLSDMGAEIQQSVLSADGTKISHYVRGGTAAPGRSRWIDCNVGDSAATQAATILAALTAG